MITDNNVLRESLVTRLMSLCERFEVFALEARSIVLTITHESPCRPWTWLTLGPNITPNVRVENVRRRTLYKWSIQGQYSGPRSVMPSDLARHRRGGCLKSGHRKQECPSR